MDTTVVRAAPPRRRRDLVRALSSRVVRRLHRWARLAALPVFRRLLLLALLGVLLTLTVAGTALIGMNDVGAINRELGAVSRALRFHQDADMMHDALRADVTHAQTGPAGLDAAAVRQDTATHAGRLRDDLATIRALPLPADIAAALERLRPARLAYTAQAEHLVHVALLGDGTPKAERARFQAAFGRLVPAQAALTDRLAAASARTQQAAIGEQRAARRMVAFSSFAALGGWMVLVVWLTRSLGDLRAALLREAEQRSAADLLQSSLLPRRLPAVDGLALAARLVPGRSGRRVGGDWYDVLSLPGGEIGLVIGDVVGHDLPAATAMGELRNALRAYALDESSPAAVLARVNRAAHLLEVADMATCLYAVLDPSTRCLRWSTAGHLPPLLCPAVGAGRVLGADPGPPLGVSPLGAYRDHELQLEPGQTLVLYTDGLVERRGCSIDAGLDGLEEFRGNGLAPEAMCDALLAAQLGDAVPGDALPGDALPGDALPGDALPGDNVPGDDVTLLLVQVDPSGTGVES